jgi:hypothetical protein
VRVTGLPNLDLDLSITDADGLHGAIADEAGVGDGEVLHRRTIEGPLVVTIAQTVPKGQLPVENVSDAYTLTVSEDAPSPDFEAEPNGTSADATPLVPGRELRGYLDTRGDVDVLRWTGGDGTFVVTIRADAIPLAWRTADGKLRTPGAATVELHKGDLIRLERTDREASGPLLGRDATWSIVVAPATPTPTP